MNRLCTALIAFTTVLLWLACAPPPPEPSGAAPQGAAPVTVACWNVANFFDAVDDPNQDDVPTSAQRDEKVRRLAAVVEALDADFLALEEVENLDCLRGLNAALDRPYPQLGLIEGNDTARGIDVAFLSRLPVSKVVSHRDYDLPNSYGVSKNYRFSRDCLQVRLATQPAVTVFVNHFKSQLGSKKDSANKRRVQSEGVVAIGKAVAADDPDGFEVVLGDLNDRPDSWSLQPLFSEYQDVCEGWPAKMRASHRSKRGATPLDHILLSRDAAGRLEGAKVWQNLGKGTSDHDPVSAVIRLDVTPVRDVKARTWSQPG